MPTDDDELLLVDEPDEEPANDDVSKKWRVLVVDDDIEVHRSTQMVLDGFRVDGAALHLYSAYSGEQAIEVLQNTEENLPDLVLMDVVMQTATDGIDTADRIRNQLAYLRIPVIFIRTGQAGNLLRLEDLASHPSIDRVLYKADLDYQSLRENVREGLAMSQLARQKP